MLADLAAVSRESGLAGQYRGVGALFMRGGLISAGQLWGYGTGKRTATAYGLREGPATHVACSFFAAACACLLSAPADIVLNRFQAAPKLGVRYESLSACAAELMRNDGPLAFFRGVGTQYVKVAPIFLITLPLYEQFRRLAGLGYLMSK